MSQFIESIKILNGKIFNLDLHQKRLDLTFKQFFPDTEPFQLNKIIEVPAEDGVFKLRIVYSKNDLQVNAEKYQVKTLKNLHLVEIADYDYSYKYADRSFFERLYNDFPEYDDFILTRNNLVTDSTYANLVFYDQKNWLTPDTPLLAGTKREELISKNKIIPAKIKAKDIKNFESFVLINSMLDFEPEKYFYSTAIIQ